MWRPHPGNIGTPTRLGALGPRVDGNKQTCNTYEAIAATLARLSIGDDHGFLDVAELLEELPQRLVGRVIGQSADEDFCVGRVFLLQS